MSNKDVERFKRTGMVFRDGRLIAADQVVKAGVTTVQHYSTNNKVKFLADSLHSGKLSESKLKRVLEDNAHKEMRKGYDKMSKGGKPVTVDMLLDEYNRDINFQNLASEVGLDRAWFTNLAETEIKNRRGSGQGDTN